MVHLSIPRMLLPVVISVSLAACGGANIGQLDPDAGQGSGNTPGEGASPNPSITPTPAATPSPKSTASPNVTPTPVATPSSEPTSVPIPSSTPSTTPTVNPTPSATPSATPSPSPTPSSTPNPSDLSCTQEGDGDWLRTVGNVLVDKDCNPVWMTGANWFGFNATERVFHGLWSANMEALIKAMTERGINMLRVPISTELMLEWRDMQFKTINVNDHANPELKGLNSLEVFDQFLALSEKYGLKVMLDVHSAEADNSGHVAPMWYKGAIDSEMYYQAWEWFAQRYKSNDTLIAYDLENEPHGKPWETNFAKWDGSQDTNNWKHACETAANRILAIHSRVLVLCEGIEVYPKGGSDWSSMDAKSYYNNWWGGNLRGVADHPVTLGEHQDQLLYSPHDYGPLVFAQPWFTDGFNFQSLFDDVWQPNWFFIHEQDISPLFIGEWGGFMDKGDNEKWMGHIRDLISGHYIHHTFWVLNPNSGDTGGLITHDWKTWDEDKYQNMLLPTLWRNSTGLFVGLDHEVPLGGNAGTGITVTEFYANDGQRPEGPEATSYR